MFSCIQKNHNCSICQLKIDPKKEIVLYSLVTTDHKVRVCSQNCLDIFRKESSHIHDYKENK